MGEPLTSGRAGMWFELCAEPEPVLKVQEDRFGNKLCSTRTLSDADSYLVIPWERTWVGVGPNVYRVRGKHVFRDDFEKICLECVLTNAVLDVKWTRFHEAAKAGNPWTVLTNEMEVLAWVSR